MTYKVNSVIICIILRGLFFCDRSINILFSLRNNSLNYVSGRVFRVLDHLFLKSFLSSPYNWFDWSTSNSEGVFNARNLDKHILHYFGPSDHGQFYGCIHQTSTLDFQPRREEVHPRPHRWTGNRTGTPISVPPSLVSFQTLFF